jgi:uncharacterized sulfatase
MASQSRQPNILFFFSDQQRWDTAGCYGQKLPITPHLDRMAAEGVRFDLALTPQPVCGPARACLQTGKYATETGCFRNGVALGKDEMTLPRWLSAAGYEVGYIGKWHLASTVKEPVPPELRGGYEDFWLASDVPEFTSHGYDGHMFDGDMRRVDFKGYRVDCQTDFALNYLRTRDGRRPWFLFLSYLEPHHQNDHNRFEGPEGSKERFKNFVVPGDLAGTEGDWRENLPDYLGCCNSLDTNLGRIRNELEKLRMADNTLIFYASDHGCHFRTRNSEYKRSCHEASTRVPLVICGPGFRSDGPNLCPGADPTAAGKVVRRIVSLIDLPPTVLAAAGAAVPASMRGRPLQGLAGGTVGDWRDEAFIQISESQVGRALRTPKWKYSASAPDKKGGEDPASERYVEEFLYDLEKDPHERSNLVKDPALAGVRRGLAERLKARIVEAGEKPASIEPAA